MTDCILWTGALNSGGYPVTWKDGKTIYKHRHIAGAKKGDVVMHTCDVRACINPHHLIVGTSADNSSDMVKKDRQAKGEACGNSKFTEQIVTAIRKMKGTRSSRFVGEQFGMSKTNVLDIWNNKIWSHI